MYYTGRLRGVMGGISDRCLLRGESTGTAVARMKCVFITF